MYRGDISRAKVTLTSFQSVQSLCSNTFVFAYRVWWSILEHELLKVCIECSTVMLWVEKSSASRHKILSWCCFKTCQISLFHWSHEQVLSHNSNQICHPASFMSKLTTYFKSSRDESLSCLLITVMHSYLVALILQDIVVCLYGLDYFRAWLLRSRWILIVKNIPRILFWKRS